MAGRKVDLLSKLAIAGAQLGVIDITMATAAVIHWMLIDPLLPRATRPSYVLVSLLAVGGMLVVVIGRRIWPFKLGLDGLRKPWPRRVARHIWSQVTDQAHFPLTITNRRGLLPRGKWLIFSNFNPDNVTP